jgi:endonuclease/exonuclease/phosphatase family metal-dependent hydrolase
LSLPQELFFDLPPSGGLNWMLQLRPAVGRLLRLPVLGRLRPAARRAAAVAAPPGALSFRPQPTRPDPKSRPTMAVLSANLWHDWPRHRRLLPRLEAVAQLIENEDVGIALLQEVARTPDLRADAWLADRLGMAYVYSRANGHETAAAFEEGVAILSRYPLSIPSLIELKPSTPFTRRLSLGVQVDTGWGHWQAFSVHLGMIPGQNAAQIAHLQEWVSDTAGALPTFIGGDFNAHEDSPQISRMQQHWIDTFRWCHPQSQGITHEFRWPWGLKRRRRLDYLFLRPGAHRWQILDARHLDAPGGPHSDHRAVLTRFEFAR